MRRRYSRPTLFVIGEWPNAGEGWGISIYKMEQGRLKVGHLRTESYWLKIREEDGRKYVQKGAEKLFLDEVRWSQASDAIEALRDWQEATGRVS